MENSSSNLDSPQLDKSKCWTLFYIDEDDNVMHDFGWRADEDIITLAQLLMAIKHTKMITQSLQMAYLSHIESASEDASSIAEIIQAMETSKDLNSGSRDFISPLFNNGDQEDE